MVSSIIIRKCGKRKKGTLDDVITTPKRPRTGESCSPTVVTEWSPKYVYQTFLRKFPEVAKLFQDHNVSGNHLMKLSATDLEDMGIKECGIQENVMKFIATLNNSGSACTEKVFNDPIHGHIELHPLMVEIIDTPQFQRLRNIKQLGGGYYVFMGASHNRFEHSIGVGYLAGELVETLQRKQPELDISERDILCVKIAGLCHDLGHGPFSHMFDCQFIQKVKPGISWKHEQGSVMMFEHLMEVNELGSSFQRFQLDERDILFIKEQIYGPTEMCSQQNSSWPYKGRTEEKSFLYEIVSNKRNGIDVDKWDYFSRDCHCLGIPNNFDLRRYMKFARVIDVDSRRQICTRDKEVLNLYEMFHTRATLHRRAYQHKTANIIEFMITEALIKADEHLLIPGENGLTKMSDAIYDPYAYTRLTDSVFQQIIMSNDPNLQESQDILLNVERRRLYKFIGQTQCTNDDMLKEGNTDVIAKEIIDSFNEDELDELPKLTAKDLVVEIVTFDYGMKDEDPISHMRFYDKDDLTRAVEVQGDQVSQMLPQKFKEQTIRMYIKRMDHEGILAARKYFLCWCQKYHACVTPKGANLYKDTKEESFNKYATPIKGTINKKEIVSEAKKKITFC